MLMHVIPLRAMFDSAGCTPLQPPCRCLLPAVGPSALRVACVACEGVCAELLRCGKGGVLGAWRARAALVDPSAAVRGLRGRLRGDAAVAACRVLGAGCTLDPKPAPAPRGATSGAFNDRLCVCVCVCVCV